MTADSNVIDFDEARARLKGFPDYSFDEIDDTEVVDGSEITMTVNDVVYTIETTDDYVVVYADDENATNEDINYILDSMYSNDDTES